MFSISISAQASSFVPHLRANMMVFADCKHSAVLLLERLEQGQSQIERCQAKIEICQAEIAASLHTLPLSQRQKTMLI